MIRTLSDECMCVARVTDKEGIPGRPRQPFLVRFPHETMSCTSPFLFKRSVERCLQRVLPGDIKPFVKWFDR